MERSELLRWFENHAVVEETQLALEVDEALDQPAMVAQGLGLCDSVRALFPAAYLEGLAAEGDEEVRATWARLRAGRAGR